MRSKLFYVLLFICSFIHKANAQSRVHFGIKAGANFPHFNVSKITPPLQNIYDDNYFYAGGQLDIRLSKHFSLQPELFYVGHPVQEVVITAGPFERLHQISIPILAKLRLGKVALYAGPQLDFLLKAEQHFYNATERRQVSINTTDSSYKKVQVSAAAGIEWTFKYRFGIDLRYVFGMSNIASENGASLLTFPANQRITINCIQVGLYFRFGKKPKA
jgi:hypothetical protein